jgi:hypothetical protein
MENLAAGNLEPQEAEGKSGNKRQLSRELLCRSGKKRKSKDYAASLRR